MIKGDKTQVVLAAVAILTFLFGSGIVLKIIGTTPPSPSPDPTSTVSDPASIGSDSTSSSLIPTSNETDLVNEVPEGKAKSLSIISIENVENYHYEYPDPDNESINCILDIPYGIMGHYELSWELTNQEEVFHSGKLYDSDGNEVQGIKAWASSDGMFAAELPNDMEPGTYEYELDLIINGRSYIDSDVFIIK